MRKRWIFVVGSALVACGGILFLVHRSWPPVYLAGMGLVMVGAGFVAEPSAADGRGDAQEGGLSAPGTSEGTQATEAMDLPVNDAPGEARQD